MSRASIRRATKASSLAGLMRQAAQRHHLWDVFGDFCEMAALSIANAVDLAQRAPREARYMARAKRYTAEELALFPQMLAALVNQMETGGPADVLGALFGELELGNADRGQFFTPYEVCRLMAGMNVDGPTLKHQVEHQGFVTLMEPACGAGAMVIAMTEAMREAGVEPQRHLHATCQDVDSRAVHMCYLQLSLLHIPAAVVLGNTLALECREVWYTPAHILGGWNWKLRQRHRNPMLDVANDNKEAAVQQPNPRAELEAAKANPEGQELSPEAQALHEQEGAARFAKHYPKLAKATLGPAPGRPFDTATNQPAAPAAPPPPPTEQLGLF